MPIELTNLNKMKHLKKLLYIVGIPPLGFIVSLLAFFTHARVVLGFFPKYNQPDPKQIDAYDFYEPIISWTGNIWFYSLIIWLLLITLFLIKKPQQSSWKPFIFSTITQLCAIGLFLSEIIEWYAD